MKAYVLLAALLLSPISAHGSVLPEVLDGDIIFQTSTSAQSAAIQAATTSPLSHVGIVLRRGGRPYVFEAAGRAVYTELGEWIDDGEGRRFVLMRLKDRRALAAPDGLARLHRAARAMAGRPYDVKFMWSDEKLYCSELVWKLYERALKIRLVEPRRIGSYDLRHPKVLPLVRKRYGSRIPVNEPAVAPADLASSSLLEAVR